MAKVLPVEPTSVAVKTNRHDGHLAVPGGHLAVPGRHSGLSASDRSSSRSSELSHSLIYAARHGMRDFFHNTGWYDSGAAGCIRRFLRGKLFACAAAVSLFLALFLGDVFAVAQVSSNTWSDIILTVVFAVFAGEFLGLMLVDASYLFSFFFWMDLLGTVSMVFDISYLAGDDVGEAELINKATQDGSQGNIIVVRAARAAKLGARAGRISRILKILRFLPFLLTKKEDDQKVKMARVIFNQLTNALSTRVAFLTICVVVVMPLFTMFTYPEVDDSMGAWIELLSLNAQAYHDARMSNNATRVGLSKQLFLKEVSRLSTFYSDISYGPFRVEYGESRDDYSFMPRPDLLDLSGVDLSFKEPRRSSSARKISLGRFRACFDLSAPYTMEAATNIGMICFIIIVMCCFGLFMSSSISSIALQPLERMLSVVRERCKEIFKYTVELKDEDSDSDEEDEDYDDMEQASEFMLLEKVVEKLTAIAQLSATAQEPEFKENMNENEIMVLNWMQGAQVPSTAAAMENKALAGAKGQHLEVSPSSYDSELAASMPGTSKACCFSVPTHVLQEVETENFNALDLPREVKTSLAIYMVNFSEGCAGWVRANVREEQLNSFVGSAESKYQPNPFHNFAHALDVEYTIRLQMAAIHAERFLSELQQFWLLIAGIGHDLAHPGVNNQYLVETAHELAVRYNDRSPLENMHCARLFQIASEAENNIFSQVDKDSYKEARKGMIAAILHTDVTKHNEMVKELGMLYQMNQEAFDRLEPSEAIMQSNSHVQLIINMLLHGADVGNLMKPWDLCQRYAHLCLDEFFAQGDLEKAAGIPVQMLNDRDKVNRPNSQIGFIEFVIAPMVHAQVNLFPQLDRLAHHLGRNIESWARVWEEESSPPAEAAQKVHARVEKVASTMKALVRSGAW